MTERLYTTMDIIKCGFAPDVKDKVRELKAWRDAGFLPCETDVKRGLHARHTFEQVVWAGVLKDLWKWGSLGKWDAKIPDWIEDITQPDQYALLFQVDRVTGTLELMSILTRSDIEEIILGIDNALFILIYPITAHVREVLDVK